MGLGRTWTSQEEERFAKMFAAGATDQEVAEALRRSTKAVQAHRYKNGLTVRRYIDMEPAHVAAIDRARAMGWTWRQIGAKLGFNPWCLSRRYKMAKGAKL